MLRIHQALQAGGFPNATALAREADVSSKTIHRDLEFVRDRLNLPIEFDGRRNGYTYTGEVSGFPRCRSPRAKFSLEKRSRDSFGVHAGEGKFDVVIRFNARAADYIREKKWHPSQTLHDLKGGGAELKMNLSSLAEVQRWVLSWGGDVQVLKPRELADAVRQAAAAILNPPG